MLLNTIGIHCEWIFWRFPVVKGILPVVKGILALALTLSATKQISCFSIWNLIISDSLLLENDLLKISKVDSLTSWTNEVPNSRRIVISHLLRPLMNGSCFHRNAFKLKKFCSKGNLLVFLGFCLVQVSKSTRVLIDYNQYDRFRWVMHIYLQITLSFISAILDSYEITFFFFSFFFVSPFHTWRVYSISKKKSSFQCWN